MSKLPESKIKANKKWEAKNKQARQIINKRSAAKSFIRNFATSEDITVLRKLLDEREHELNNQ
ncbi:hypothetical protein [Secundilactobacillus kimchicus]|uniref:hypothetical protein n=1 Tax=Secundilactobacillus kimchicus TaxID=528209 RepID=UPI0024A84F47|nr:hypothetical protein [Secundilactobacillus kimchicus]